MVLGNLVVDNSRINSKLSMSSNYICSSCSRRLLQSAKPPKGPQWFPRSTYISFTSNAPKQESEPSNDTRPRPACAAQARPPSSQPLYAKYRTRGRQNGEDKRDRDLEKKFELSAGLYNYAPGEGRYSKPQRQKERDGNNESYPPNLRETHSAQESSKTDHAAYSARVAPSRGRTNSRDVKSTPTPDGPATMLDETLDSNTTFIIDIWTLFLHRFPFKDCPALSNPSYSDLPKLTNGMVFRKLLNRLTQVWLSGGSYEGLPTPSEVCAKFDSLDITFPDFYVDTILTCLIEELKRSSEPALSTNFEESTANPPLTVRPEVLESVMDIWKIFFSRHFKVPVYGGLAPPPPNSGWSPEWPTVPKASYLNIMIAQNRNGFGPFFNKRVRHYFVDLPNEIHAPTIVGLLLSYELITRQEAIDPQMEPFVQAVSHMLYGAQLPSNLSYILVGPTRRRENLSPEVVDTLVERMSELPIKAISFIKNSERTPMKSDESKGENDPGIELPAEKGEVLEDYFHKRLIKAREGENYSRVVDVWDELRRIYTKTGDKSSLSIPADLYSNLIMTAMALRRPNEAIKFWNAMVASGTEPTVKTWTAMLSGCGQSRDVQAMEDIWKKMHSSGIHADMAAWTARIHSLFSCGLLPEGMRALEQMGRNWLYFAREHVKANQNAKKRTNKGPLRLEELPNFPEAPKPTTAVLNAVITPLAKGSKQRFIAQAFQWAKQFDIKADATTYNALINMAFYNNNPTEAMQVLQQMESAKVQPDVATFNILIQVTLRQVDPSTSVEEQQEVVINVLQRLESHGLEPNAVIFTTILDNLLKIHNNTVAADAVLRHMREKHIKPSASIFTILVTHHFQQPTPDLTSLRLLYEQIQAYNYAVDTVFYDRMIEGYASLGETKLVLYFLGRMEQEQKKPGWRAMIEAIVALDRAGERPAALKIIRDIQRGEGIAKYGMNRMDSTHHRYNDRMRAYRTEEEFWATVEELGLNTGQDGEEEPRDRLEVADGEAGWTLNVAREQPNEDAHSKESSGHVTTQLMRILESEQYPSRP